MSDLPAQFRARIAAMNMTQREVAEKAGIERTRLVEFLNGRSPNINVATLHRIAAALECRLVLTKGKA